jgi:hypothetical protein
LAKNHLIINNQRNKKMKKFASLLMVALLATATASAQKAQTPQTGDQFITRFQTFVVNVEKGQRHPFCKMGFIEHNLQSLPHGVQEYLQTYTQQYAVQEVQRTQSALPQTMLTQPLRQEHQQESRIGRRSHRWSIQII